MAAAGDQFSPPGKERGISIHFALAETKSRFLRIVSSGSRSPVSDWTTTPVVVIVYCKLMIIDSRFSSRSSFQLVLTKHFLSLYTVLLQSKPPPSIPHASLSTSVDPFCGRFCGEMRSSKNCFDIFMRLWMGEMLESYFGVDEFCLMNERDFNWYRRSWWTRTALTDRGVTWRRTTTEMMLMKMTVSVWIGSWHVQKDDKFERYSIEYWNGDSEACGKPCDNRRHFGATKFDCTPTKKHPIELFRSIKWLNFIFIQGTVFTSCC